MTPQLLDAKQAAELLSVPHTWLLAEARRDRIPHVRLGRYVRFDPDELERWWRARMRGPTMDGRDRGPAARQRPGPWPTENGAP
jgi:excisionase family DNA binding protein